MKKEIEKLIKEMQDAEGDWETVHGKYDDILDLIARNYEPKLMKRLGKITKDYTFWFA